MKKIRESGQSLIVIALMFLGLVAVGALVVDGGSLYLNRRTAQTASDAAAMAGAHELCLGKSDTEINTMVQTFAGNNGATTVDAPVIDRTVNATTLSHGSVSVHTTVKTASFLAGALGFKNDTVTADASAGCFIPSTSKNLLPIAWSCQPPVGGSTDHCIIHSIPWTIFEGFLTSFNFGPGLNPDMMLNQGDGVNASSYIPPSGGSKMTYLVMDSNSFDYSTSCQPPIGTGTINCDFNGDGILDVDGGANRGWLLLDGNGASDLSNLIVNGYQFPITLPTWFPGKSGVSNSVFINAHTAIGKVSLVPVFNAACSSTNATDLPTKCSTTYDPTKDSIKAGTGASDNYYRVAGFAAFVITCVSKGNSEKCPAKNYAHVDGNVSTIEGYFVTGKVGGTGIDPYGFDLGVYLVSLMK